MLNDMIDIHKKTLAGEATVDLVLHQIVKEIKDNKANEYWLDILIDKDIYTYVYRSRENFFGQLFKQIEEQCFKISKCRHIIDKYVPYTGECKWSHILSITLWKGETIQEVKSLSPSEIYEQNKTATACVSCGNPTVRVSVCASAVQYCKECSGWV